MLPGKLNKMSSLYLMVKEGLFEVRFKWDLNGKKKPAMEKVGGRTFQAKGPTKPKTIKRKQY